MFGWNIFDTNRTVGGLLGYESENVRVRRNEPSSKGVSAGVSKVELELRSANEQGYSQSEMNGQGVERGVGKGKSKGGQHRSGEMKRQCSSDHWIINRKVDKINTHGDQISQRSIS